jgi:hemolysin activation/secretion protein
LDPELQLLLGGDNGLRGYPLRYESGTSRAFFTIEQRFFTDWYPFRLARVGAAVFADAGRTWGNGARQTDPANLRPDPGMLSDVGFGLRLGNTRTGLGNVLHVDFAFPLKNIAGIQKFQFLVQTYKSF